MSNFLKNFISYLERRKIILLSALCILLFLSFPLPAAAQGFWGFVRDAILFLPTLLVATMLVVMLLLTQGIAYLVGALLDWVISPGFVSLSYTVPCPGPSYTPGPANCNPIIGIGLDITQHFVNLLLVVVLVFIALSIALRIGEDDAKKILFRKFILIALLVNFAPVLCGLIVDASNITMNYFLGPIKGGVSGVLTQVAPFVDSVKKAIWGSGGEIANRLGVLAMGSSQIFLNLCIAFAFLLFTALFIFRYIMIWMLVILAPLAFVAWILPSTKKYWDMWWGQLIQWSIIGIPVAFFLYLALGSFSVLSVAFRANVEAPAIESATLGIFNQEFPFFVVIIFLFLGFLAALQISAVGTAGIMGLVKKAPGKAAAAGKWTAKAGAGAARGIPAVSRAEESIRRRLEGSRIGRLVGGPGAQERERKVRMDAAKKWVERTPETPQGNQDLTRIIQRRALTDEERYRRASAIETLAKRKSLDLSPADAARFLPEAQRYGADISTILKARPDFAPHIVPIDPATGRPRVNASGAPQPMSVGEAMSKITPGDFWQNVQGEAFTNPDVILQTMLDVDKIARGRSAQKSLRQTFKNAAPAVPIPPGLTPQQSTAVMKSANLLANDARWQV